MSLLCAVLRWSDCCTAIIHTLQFPSCIRQAAPDWSPHRFIATGDNGDQQYMHRVVPFVVKVETEVETALRCGTGTVIRFVSSGSGGPPAGWYLLTAAHVLHRCTNRSCSDERCIVDAGRVVFFDEVRAGVREVTVEMSFAIDDAASSVQLFSPPPRDPEAGSPSQLSSGAMDIIAVRYGDAARRIHVVFRFLL